jgi:hypothetical protein
MMRKFDDITEPEDFDPKQMQLEFAPGCFDDFEGTQAELDELVAELQRMFASGEFAEKTRAVNETEILEMSAELQQKLHNFLSNEMPKRNLN